MYCCSIIGMYVEQYLMTKCVPLLHLSLFAALVHAAALKNRQYHQHYTNNLTSINNE